MTEVETKYLVQVMLRQIGYSVRIKEDLNGHTYLEGENLFSALRRLFLYQFESLNGNHPPSFFVICSTRYWKSTKSWKRTKSHTVRRTGTKNIATRGTDRNVSNQASDNDLERLLDCFSFFFFLTNCMRCVRELFFFPRNCGSGSSKSTTSKSFSKLDYQN